MANVFDYLLQDNEEEENQQRSLVETVPTAPAREQNVFDLLLDEQPSEVRSVTPSITVDEPSIEMDELGLMGDTTAISSYEELRRNPNIKVAAQRFAIEHLGMKDISPEDAIDEMISHFRSFNVNEMTAAGDYNYVSGLKADSESGASYADDARRKLNDYRVVFDAFNAMPDFYEDNGAPSAFSDYASGILTAPSTYVGLLLPGFGKGAGMASSVAAKTAVARALGAMASRPVMTTAAVEGGAGALQDIAAQQTEMEIGRRDEYNVLQTGLVAGVSAALPAALTLNAVKSGAGKIIDAGTPDVLAEAMEAQTKARQAAGKKAAETIKKNKELGNKFKSKLAALNPEKVAAGQAKKAEISKEARRAYICLCV